MKGLVLIGGQSKRMGKAKGKLTYYAIEQQYHVYQLLSHFCTSVYLSCRAEQANQILPEYHYVIDQYEDIGPLSGVLSAFEKYPNESWLVVACDMPYINIENLNYLVEHRLKDKIATVYKHNGMLEPLLGIWEAESFHHLKAGFKDKRYSLRRVLEANDVNIVEPKTSKTILNINTKIGYLKVLNELKKGNH